jgi:hypothetical protein
MAAQGTLHSESGLQIALAAILHMRREFSARNVIFADE